MSWFEVNKEGLKKVLGSRSKVFILYELLQNAWDEPITQVEIKTYHHNDSKCMEILVTDDSPNGFKHIEHAYTLFAESDKKINPEQRGRFNAGEKFVLAFCNNAILTTTSGTINFNADGSRTMNPRRKTRAGSVFNCVLKDISTQEYNSILDEFNIIPQTNIKTLLNGKEIILKQKHITTVKIYLPTVISDVNGNLKISDRKTVINIYESNNPTIFEMGIPVCSNDTKFDIDVSQKIPLNIERNAPIPAFIKKLNVEVLNASIDYIEKDDTIMSWVQEATENKNCETKTIQKIIKERFGNRAVSFDPTDLEANKLAVSEGYSVIHGNTLSKKTWENVRKAGCIKPAGQITPSPKPFSPDGTPLEFINPKDYTLEMKTVIAYCHAVSKCLLGHIVLQIRITNTSGWPFSATYGSAGLIINAAGVEKDFFTNKEKQDALLIHEFAHEYESDHLSRNYHRILCGLGAKLARAIRNKDLQ